MGYKWEIYKDKAGEFRARFKNKSEVMFSSEGYSSKQSAMNAIASMKKNAPAAKTIDDTGDKPKPDKKVAKQKPKTLGLGENCVIMPLGSSSGMGASVIGFDNGLVGILWKALPDDLAGTGTPGEPLSEEGVARMAKCNDAPSVFLHAQHPEALYGLSEMAADIADQWMAYLEKTNGNAG